MNDSHGRSETTTSSASGAAPGARSGAVRPVLWVLLVIFVAGDLVVTRVDVNMAVDVAFGLATLGCAAGLIVHHYRNRRG